MIDIHVNGVSAKMLLDTGAGEGYLLRHHCFKFPLVLDKSNKLNVQLASGKYIETLGVARLDIRFIDQDKVERVDLHVIDVEDLPSGTSDRDLMVIAGRRLLQQWNITIEGDGRVRYVVQVHEGKVPEGPPILDSNTQKENEARMEKQFLVLESTVRLDSQILSMNTPREHKQVRNIDHVLDSAVLNRSAPDGGKLLESNGSNSDDSAILDSNDIHDEIDESDDWLGYTQEVLDELDGFVSTDEGLIVGKGPSLLRIKERDDTSLDWRVIFGSREYRIRERVMETEECLDTPKQERCFEIDWKDIEHKVEPVPRKKDYSKAILSRLDPEDAANFRKEITQYVENQWWKPADSYDADGHGPVVCFPVLQPEKSTKVRPVIDGRAYNKNLTSCSYLGPDCGNILRQIRAGCGSMLRECTETAQIVTLDLRQAFYRIRLRAGRTVSIRTDGRSYTSGRVTFGTTYGPASLEAAVRALLYKAMHKSKMTPWCQYYLDDITVIGSNLNLFIETLVEIAELYGFEFPLKKRHVINLTRQGEGWIVEPFEPFSHLGAVIACSDGQLYMKCKESRPPEVQYSSISKREGFAVAGCGIDRLWMHPEKHIASDIIRRLVGGASDWDTRIDGLNEKEVGILVAQIRFLPCQHMVLLNDIKIIEVETDASDWGYGYEIRVNGLPMVRRSRLWGGPQENWHANRKEHYATVQAMIMLNDFAWYAKGAKLVIRSDSKSGLSWLNGSTKTKSMNKICIERLASIKEELLDSWKNFFPDAKFEKIPGKNNCAADYLSRLPHILGLSKSTVSPRSKTDVMMLASSLQGVAETAYTSDASDSIRKAPILRVWSAWRRITASTRGEAYTDADDSVHRLLVSMQKQSVMITAHFRFLEDKQCSGFPLTDLLAQTQYRFIGNGLLYHLRFLNGDITLDPYGVVVIDASTPLGEHILTHLAKEVHEEYGHATIRYCTWRLSKMIYCHGTTKVVTAVVQDCHDCVVRARKHARRAGYLVQRKLDTSAEAFFDVVSIDLYSVPQTRQSDGIVYVIVLIDHFSRFCLVEGLQSKSAKYIQEVLDRWFTVFTTPGLIRSDNSKEFKALSRLKRYNWYRIPTYSPFSNGICERVMGSLNTFVSIKNWSSKIHLLQKLLNAKKIEELGMSPTEIVFGRDHNDLAETVSFASSRRARDDVRLEVLRLRELREPTRALPSKLELQLGDIVVRTYDPQERRNEFLVRDIKNSVNVVVEDLVTRKCYTEHLRNLKVVPISAQPGGTDVE